MYPVKHKINQVRPTTDHWRNCCRIILSYLRRFYLQLQSKRSRDYDIAPLVSSPSDLLLLSPQLFIRAASKPGMSQSVSRKSNHCKQNNTSLTLNIDLFKRTLDLFAAYSKNNNFLLVILNAKILVMAPSFRRNTFKNKFFKIDLFPN